MLRASWNRWENGKALPDLDQVLKIADGFQVSVDSLLREKTDAGLQSSTGPGAAVTPAAPPQDDPALAAQMAAVRDILTSDHEVAKAALIPNIEAFHKMVVDRKESQKRAKHRPKGQAASG